MAHDAFQRGTPFACRHGACRGRGDVGVSARRACGSVAIEGLFESSYTRSSEPYDDSAFDGRSDYQAFIDNGIPAGGLFTGAEEIKTAAQAAIWGGTVGAQFDPCYHEACDTFANVNLHVLDVNVDAVAFAVLTYAYSTETVNGVPGKSVPAASRFRRPPAPKERSSKRSISARGRLDSGRPLV